MPQIRLLAAGNMFNTFGMTSDDIIYEPLPFYHSAALLLGFGNTVTKGKTFATKTYEKSFVIGVFLPFYELSRKKQYQG